MSLVVVGDIHGKYKSYLNLLDRYKNRTSVQIGDFGIGFEGDDPLPAFPEDARFFRGNHDNPALADGLPNCLGKYGVRTVGGITFFFVAGAWSSDQWWRTEGLNWWREEELTIPELNEALNLYIATKPDIVLSHDGPDPAIQGLCNDKCVHKEFQSTRTGQALTAMFEAHQPLKWIFGHWHVNWAKKIGRTKFRCLAELNWCEINEKGANGQA